MTVAALGLAVDSSQVTRATPELVRMTNAADGAEAAAGRLGRSTGAASAMMAKMLTVMESIERDLTVLTNHAINTGRAFEGMGAGIGRGLGGANLAMMNSRNLMFQLVDIGQGLPLLLSGNIYGLQNLGFQIAQIGQLYWGQGGFGAALRDAGGILGPLVSKLAPIAIAVGAVAAGFAGLTYEINKTADTQVGFGDVFMATVQLAAEGIMNLLGPAIAQVGRWLAQLWDFIAPTMKNVGNAIVGAFVGAFEGVKATWSLFPAAIGDLVIQGVNGVIGAVEGMINGVSHAINGFIDQVNGAIQMIPENLRGGWTGLGKIGDVGFGRVDNPNAGAAGAAASGIGGAFSDAMSTDWMGQAFDAISDRAQKLQLEQLAEEAEEAAKGLKAANDNGRDLEKMLSDVEPLLRNANDPLLQLQDNLYKLGELLKAGEISWDEYSGAVQRANLSAASGVLGAVGQITGALSQAFEDNKALAVANAVINTAEGVTKALAQGGIFGFASAAAIGISGAAQIASILSAKPGSASTASVPSSAPTPTTAAAGGGSQQAVNITLRGENFSRASVERLIGDIADVLKDGGGSGFIKVVKAA